MRQKNSSLSSQKRLKQDQTLLRNHREHIGVYSRVAEQLKVDASLVSRVANGSRNNGTVLQALLKELAILSRAA
jgi:hypothetical protein